MSISSISFLFFFLPLTLIIYYLVNEKLKEYVLVIFSLLFYALASLKYFFIFLFAISITIIIGRLLAKRKNKLLLICGIIFNLSLLSYFKYHDSLLSLISRFKEISFKELLLPLGISFYTFKAISYLVDIYKGKIALDKPFIHDALYLSFFGQVISGPLSRYEDFNKKKENKFESFSKGLWRFLNGFIKKVLIANILSSIVSEVYGTDMVNISTSLIWLGAIAYSLELYYDFSSYSDMAIGITQMFGYECKENFDYPYMSSSISEFWRRWHISLGAWFKDYVYIPLGGSRCKLNRIIFNLLVVWLLTGIWHGATLNFLFWGLAYFVLVSLEKIFNIPNRFKNKVLKFIYHISTILMVNFLWVIFRTNNLFNGLVYIKNMLIFRSNSISDLRVLVLFKEYLPIILIALILCFPINKLIKDNKYLDVIKRVLLIGLFIVAVVFMIAGQNNPFAYANF